MPVDDYWGSESTELEVEEAVEVDLNGNPVVPTAGRDIPKSIIEAEGDLIVGREAGAPERLPAGATGQALVVAADGGLEWEDLASPEHEHEEYAETVHTHDEYATDADLADHLATAHAGLATDAELAAHEGAANPHPGYLTPAEGDAAYAPVHAHPYAPTSHSHVDADIPAGIARDSEVTAAVSAHEGAGNPHPTYATDADLTAHAGAADPHPTYETSAEAAAKITTHEAAADPHTGYLRETVVSGPGTPGLTLGTANAAGSATTVVRTDATIAAFDATAPSTQAFGDAAAVGAAAVAARRDHKHAMPANPVTAHEAAADPHAGYVLESLIDAKGDLIVGTADNTVSRLAAGTNGHVLTADSSLAAGVKWAAAAGGGGATIIQQDDPPASPVTGDLWIDTNEATQVGLSSIIGYGELASTWTGAAASGEQAVPGLSVTVTVPAGRRLRITASLHLRSTVATDILYGRIMEDATGKDFNFGNENAAGGATPQVVSIVSPSAGTHTYTAKIARAAGSGTPSVYSAGGEASYILVEDITGTLWPAGTPMVPPPRVGWHLTRAANQSIALDTLTNISWDTEVQDTPNNFTPHATTGTTLTIPSGGGGLWAITFQADPQAALATMQHARLEIVAGGMTFKLSDNDDVTTPVVPGWCLSPTVPLNDGDTIICKFIHSATAAVNFRGRLLAYRIGS